MNTHSLLTVGWWLCVDEMSTDMFRDKDIWTECVNSRDGGQLGRFFNQANGLTV